MASTEDAPVDGKNYYNPTTQSQADVSADSTVDDDDRRNIEMRIMNSNLTQITQKAAGDDNDTGTVSLFVVAVAGGVW